MKDLNQCNFIGRLGRDVELKYTQSGKAVGNFSIAVNGYKDEVSWINCVVWEKLATICEQYLHKGSQVFISGRMQTRSYEDKDGNKKYVTEIVVSEMQMLGGKQDSGDVPYESQQVVDDGSIPF